MLKDIEKTLRSHPFITPWYLQNAHLQTVFPGLFPYFTIHLPKPERKLISLPEGSKLVADCFWQKSKNNCATIVSIGGFEGYRSMKPSRFALSIAQKAYYLGYNVIHLKQRGEGDSIHLTKSIGYNPDDLPIAFEQFHSWGLKQIFVAAYSAGGYSLLFSLGVLGERAKSLVSGAVIISAPSRMSEVWQYVEKNPFYDRIFLSMYKHFIRRRAKIDPPGTWNIKELNKIKTKQEWGKRYMHQWDYVQKVSTLEEFDQKSDAILLSKNIQIPTLIINAHDDPLSPIAGFTTIHNNNIITLIPNHGGHGGFFTTKKLYGDLDGHWAQNRAMEFIQLLQEQDSK